MNTKMLLSIATLISASNVLALTTGEMKSKILAIFNTPLQDWEKEGYLTPVTQKMINDFAGKSTEGITYQSLYKKQLADIKDGVKLVKELDALDQKIEDVKGKKTEDLAYLYNQLKAREKEAFDLTSSYMVKLNASEKVQAALEKTSQGLDEANNALTNLLTAKTNEVTALRKVLADTKKSVDSLLANPAAVAAMESGNQPKADDLKLQTVAATLKEISASIRTVLPKPLPIPPVKK